MAYNENSFIGVLIKLKTKSYTKIKLYIPTTPLSA